MLLLVLSDGHVRRLVDEDVRRHEHRVRIKTEARQIALLPRLLLELRHAVEPAERG